MTVAERAESAPGPGWLPWVLGLVAGLVYALTRQRQLFNDGIFFEYMVRLGGEHLIYNHILYLPMAWVLKQALSLVVGIDAEATLKLLSAIAGGCGVGLTYVVARECLQSVRGAVISALLLASLVGYWFHSTVTELHSVHAACATILLLGLLRTLHRQRLDTPGSCLLLAAGTALTPASHVAGLCALLPVGYVWWHAGAARRRFLVSVGSGGALFGTVYVAILLLDPGSAGYFTAHAGKHGAVFEDPSRIPWLLQGCASEFLLYSAPAAALVPAGLRVLWGTAPRFAGFLLCWLLAWPMIAWAVPDRAVGSYYTATFPVQAILAVVAMHSLATSALRAFLVALLAIAPLPIFVFAEVFRLPPEPIGLVGLALSATGLALLAGRRPAVPVAVWWLPVLAFVTTLPHILNVQRLDPRRDRIAEVAAVVAQADRTTGKRSLVVYLAVDTSTAHHWKHFFPGAYGDETRALNPVELAFLFDPTKVAPKQARFEAVLREALADGRPVFLEGSPERARAVADNRDVDRFLGLIQRLTEQEPAGAPLLWRLRPRR